MCTACTTASQHFNDATTPRERPLATSVQDGTSPDWGQVRNGMNENTDSIPRFGADSYGD